MMKISDKKLAREGIDIARERLAKIEECLVKRDLVGALCEFLLGGVMASRRLIDEVEKEVDAFDPYAQGQEGQASR